MTKGEIRSNTILAPEATESHVSGLAGVFYSPDIAGTAYLTGAQKGSTGRPVPLLMDFLIHRR